MEVLLLKVVWEIFGVLMVGTRPDNRKSTREWSGKSKQILFWDNDFREVTKTA